MESGSYYNGRGYNDSAVNSSRGGEYNISSAIDWSLFEGRSDSVNYRENRKKSTGSTGKSGSKSSSVKRTGAAEKSSKGILSVNKRELARAVAFGIMIVCAVGILLSCRMEEHEIALQLDSANAQLNELQQDYRSLDVAFETHMNGPALEEYAVNVLGMQKREISQTEWISLSGGDVFEYTEEENFRSWLQEQTDRLLSYFD